MPKQVQFKSQILKKYGVFDDDITLLLDDIAALASEGCEKPFAMVSFIDDSRQVIISQIGSLPQNSDIIKTFCAHTLQQSDVFEICDTLRHDKTKQNDFVQQTSKIRYYAGVPLINSQGQALGSLCVLDTVPNALTKHQQSILKLLARDVVSQLELRQKNTELAKLKDLHLLITENNPDLIFAKDKDFKIIHANSAFLSVYPKEARDKVIGFTTLEKYNEQEAYAFLEQDRLAFEKGQSETLESIIFPSGERHILFTTKTRFEDDDGKPYILGVSRDVTQRENLIALLKKSNNDLDEFAYIASHDLKAPLNAIKRLVSWIEEDASEVLQGDSLEHFAMIKNRVNRMNMLLKDLLDYSRVGKNDGVPQALNLHETATHCFALLDLPDGFIIEIDNADIVLPKLPLELVLTNLMSNAIKHHDKNAGLISIKCESLQHNYLISVTDDGPGIDPSLHEKIFKKFQTVKPRDEVEGSGLGLAMVEKALANYSGTISIKSELGKGTTFTAKWPKSETNKND